MRVLLLPNAKYLANVYITHTVLPRMRKQACKLLIVQDEKSTDCGGMEEGIVVLCGHSCVCINSWYSWLGARLKSLLLPTLSQNNRNLCIKVKPRAQMSRSDFLFIHFWPRIQAFSVVQFTPTVTGRVFMRRFKLFLGTVMIDPRRTRVDFSLYEWKKLECKT